MGPELEIGVVLALVIGLGNLGGYVAAPQIRQRNFTQYFIEFAHLSFISPPLASISVTAPSWVGYHSRKPVLFSRIHSNVKKLSYTNAASC